MIYSTRIRKASTMKLVFFTVVLTVFMVQRAAVGAFLAQPSTGSSIVHSRPKAKGQFHPYKSYRPRSQSSSRLPHLFMSSSTPTKHKIVFQKTVRPPKNGSPSFFLGQLVEYLQDRFELPTNIPMIYNSVQISSSSKFIIAWDSPLSSSSDATQLNVEVVGIFKDNNENFPSMAMVVVSKNPCQAAGIPMMQSLFADAEKKIIKALERGLEDFEAGRIKLSSPTEVPEAPTKQINSLEDCIEAELMEKSHEPAMRRDMNAIIDTTATEDKQISPPIPVQRPSSNVGMDDFAVQAARKAANHASQNQTRDKSSESIGGDFAVDAAKKIAAKRASVKKDEPTTVPKTPKVKGETTSKGKNPMIEPENSIFPSPPQMANSPGFNHVISTPDDYKQKRQKGKAIAKTNTMPKQTVSQPAEVPPVDKTLETSAKDAVKDKASERKLNLRVFTEENMEAESVEFDDAVPATPSPESQLHDVGSSNKMPSKEEMELEISKAALHVMDEIAEEAGDITAEEMLRNVMQFGEEIKKEETVGTGFATGAFEKAKKILQDQKQKREDRLGFKEVSNSRDFGIKFDVKELEGKSVEEELKSLFLAGERLADQRIHSTTEHELTKLENEKVDELIDAEKTISGYARSLDDELTELEVRINKSPGEELDGPMRNPFFDVMSGPEVYNPNVDPETAVNWPGALPGTKNVRLPTELKEALKQAKFAAEVMLKLREEESVGESGGHGARYFVGDREISKEQVENLRKVVSEGVKIGIIDDPLEFLAERSRLQMILDELWNQPDERFKEIAENYKDLLLSENFVNHVKERLAQMVDRDVKARARGDADTLEADHAREREILGQLVVFTQLLIKETRALGAELEAQQLELVRSICKVAMDPTHATEEDTAIALSDVVRDLRPMFDDVFVAYLKYAVAEEKGRLARAGLLDDPDHNQWLFVLQIVQQGVYNEISKGISRYIDHIWYVLRMRTRTDRRKLLEQLIDVMPTMDVRPFVQVVENIVSSLGDAVRGDFDPAIGEMTNKLLQLRVDVHELLPPERIDIMARDADEWAARQKEKMMEARNQTKQRMKAAREIENNPSVEGEIRRRGETERFD